MKNLALINCYQFIDIAIGYWMKRKKDFERVFLPIKNEVSVDYIKYTSLKNSEIYKKIINYDGIIFSGSSLNMSIPRAEQKMKYLMKLIKEYSKPLLGICFGHQLVGYTYGFKCGDTINDRDLEWEKIISLELTAPVKFIDDNPLVVSEKHHEEIKYTPEFENIFKIYASSPACKIQIIKHLEKPLYGVQFHPETHKDPIAQKHGTALLQNFARSI
ncbi:MAG: hypothetical protein GY870_14215 [archaeon]|nr:hypothetical protein [archaeon]